MVASLFGIPDFQQIRLQSFKLETQVLDVFLNLFRRTAAVFFQKRENSSAIKRGQALNNVIPAHDGFGIRGGKLVYGSDPQVDRIAEVVFIESGDMLQFGERGCRKYGSK